MAQYSYDGKTIEAKDAADLVAKMHEQSEAPAKTDLEWMVQVSDRAKVQFGHAIDSSSPEAFVASLVETGALKEK